MIYRDLNIHQRINVRSWARHDMPTPCIYHTVLLYTTVLPKPLSDNIDTPCDKETLLFRRNWPSVRFGGHL